MLRVLVMADAREPASRTDVRDALVAALLAVLVAAGVGAGLRVEATRRADRAIERVATHDLPFKYQTLTLERAALARRTVLPVFGSSELFCCGSPFRPTQLFAKLPRRFHPLALGHAGTQDLFFAATFAALGRDLAGRKIVLSDSPGWFFARRGVDPLAWQSNFVPAIAYAVAFGDGASARLRTVLARRMLAYPATYADDPLLRRALVDVAEPTWWHRLEHATLRPAGDVATWLLDVRDAARTITVLRQRPWRHAAPPSHSTAVAWPQLARLGSTIAAARDSTNTFGFPDVSYRVLRGRRRFVRALVLEGAGATNRDGTRLPPPTLWEDRLAHSTEWTDLRLALRVLRDVGARPLVWTLPMAGRFEDYTTRSAPARRAFYDRWAHEASAAKVPWIAFSDHDEDPLFLTDPASHLSPRGWVFADRALDLFWHDRPIDEIRAQLARLAAAAPPTEPRPMEVTRDDR